MSFQQGLSGLNATSKDLEIIGNNIANANTYGAKSSRAEFADVYAASLNGAGANQIGIGTRLQTVSQQFTQGNITTTENPMDLAINGAGFFQLTDGRSPTMYSRNGQFKVDRNGFIVNNEALQLVGYPADGSGVIQPGQAKPLQLPSAGINPNATSKIGIEMNLDARLAVTQPASAPLIDFSNPKTYNNATSVTVFDDKGQDIALTFYFQKTSTDNWDVYATANGNSVSVDAAGDPQAITSIAFPPNGGKPTAPAAAVPVTVPPTANANGAITLPLNVQLDVTTATQYGSPFGVTDLTQNGYAPGLLSGISIESTGTVMARYSNGQAKPAGQVVLANFRNPQGLQAMGGNVWAQTFSSGTPILGVPTEGNMGVLQSGALEESNVDLTGELVNMITAQRIYQANAQTIKTQDQVMQTLVNLR
ncbi:MAG TPA: flagellar hook protein FlgE [Burkholderiaceae bacterium]|nr:flagellar hook protein FlgE [Burkholderiaceae bacterium]